LEAVKKATKMAWPLDEGRILIIIGVLLLPITNFAQNPAQLPNAAVAGSQNQISRRFEYKYSFKPPYLAQKDGTVPFFEYSGSKWTFMFLFVSKD
jgi:hypothetical protein